MTRPRRDDVTELLEATAEALGLRLDRFEFLHENVYGEGVIRCFNLMLRDENEAEISQVVYLETSPAKVESDGILVFRDDDTGDEIAVWIYPTDPALPALPVAVFPDAALRLVQRMGLPFSEAELKLVAYRPGKRAVVRVAADEGMVWLKVVRPKSIQQLHDLYALWEKARLPVPQTLGWSDEGIIGFTNLPGVVATEVVDRLDESFLDAVERIVEAYSELESHGPARASLASSRNWYARKAIERHPELAQEISEVLTRIDALLAGVTPPAAVTVHADLHLGQLFVDPDAPGEVIGILDIDTAGFGDPADDAAAMYAHLIVSQHFQKDPASPAAQAYARLAASWWERSVARGGSEDPQFGVRFTAIAATHLLAHSLSDIVPAEILIQHALTVTAAS